MPRAAVLFLPGPYSYVLSCVCRGDSRIARKPPLTGEVPPKGAEGFAKQMTEELTQPLRYSGGNFPKPLCCGRIVMRPYNHVLWCVRRSGAARVVCTCFAPSCRFPFLHAKIK